MVGFVTSNTAEIPLEAEHTPISMGNAPAGSFGEIASAAWQRGLAPSLFNYGGLLAEKADLAIGGPNERTGPILQPQDIQKKYPGVKTDAPMSDYEARYVFDAQQKEKQYQMATQNASGLKTFAAGVTATLADPINLASFFIPYVGEARAAKMLDIGTETLVGRTAARAVSGASAGVISQVPLSALTYGLNKTKQVDYGIADAMRDTLYGGVAGAIAGPLFGTLGEAIRGKPPEWAQIQSRKFSDNKDIVNVAASAVAKENPVDVTPLTNSYESQKAAYMAQQRGLVTTEISPTLRDMASKENPELFEAYDKAKKTYENAGAEYDEKLQALKDQLANTQKLPIGLTQEEEAFHIKQQGDTYEQVKEAIAQLGSRDAYIAQNKAEALHTLGELSPKVQSIIQEILPRYKESLFGTQGEQKAIQQFIEKQHENGVLGVTKNEIQETQKAAQTALDEPHDPLEESEQWKIQADELEAKYRDQVDEAAMAEYDQWKKQQSTLTDAYAKLKDCLLS